MIFAYEDMAQNAILRKIAKIYVFWLFDRLPHSDRNDDIWPEIGHLEPGEPHETIEHQKLYLGYVLRKSKKIVIFTSKMHSKNFQSRFSPADVTRTTNRYRSKIHPIGPPKPLYCGLYHQLPTTLPHILNFGGEISKGHFFGFFHLSDPLKWIT